MVNPRTATHSPLAVLVTAVASTPPSIPSNDRATTPTTAPNATSSLDRALHATLSRLVACLVNEKLVAAGLITLAACQKPAAALSLDAATSPTSSSNVIPALRRILVLGPYNSHEASLEQSTQFPDAHQIQYALSIVHSPICGPPCPIQEEEQSWALGDSHAYDASWAPVRFLDPDECESPVFTYTEKETAVPMTSVRALMHSVAKWNNFSLEIIDSICNEMASSVAHQAYAYDHPGPTPTLTSPSLEWEHSVVEGHATHPMHKARYALPPLAPVSVDEDLKRVTLHLATAPRTQLQIRGEFEQQLRPLIKLCGISDHILDELDHDDRVIFPIHARQIPNVVARFSYVQLLPYTVAATAQASMRSVVPDLMPTHVLKLPLGIKVSSALRTITPWTTFIGPGLPPVLEKLKLNRAVSTAIREESSIVAIHADTNEAKHLACLIRETATTALQRRGNHGSPIPLPELTTDGVAVCAALAERSPLGTGTPNVTRIWQLHTEAQRLAFLTDFTEKYLDAVLPPVLHNGFAFEAHQQNTLLRYDSVSGALKGFLVRDFGGIKVLQSKLRASTGITMEALPDGCAEALDLQEVYKLAYHTMFQMMLHRMVRALELHYNGKGWAVVRQCLRQRLPRQSDLYHLWLESPWVDYKCFVTMKIDGLYRDYLYTKVPNLILYQGESAGVASSATDVPALVTRDNSGDITSTS